LVERPVPTNQTPVAVTGFSSVDNTLTAVAHGLTLNASTLVTFATTGSLPVTSTQINTTQYWFARGVTVDTFKVYTTASDADADTNALTISSAGVNSTVIPWPIVSQLALEEVDFTVKTDSSTSQTLSPASTTVTGLDHLNGQVVQIMADSFRIPDQIVFNGQITLPQAASSVQVGLKYESKLVPLPPALPLVPGMLYKPRHIRDMYISYYETVGATIQGFNIPVQQMQQVVLGAPVVPQTGTFDYTLMEGWDGATPPDIEIVQDGPLPMTILALSYILEV
jgi:hypothetical protein